VGDFRYLIAFQQKELFSQQVVERSKGKEIGKRRRCKSKGPCD